MGKCPSSVPTRQSKGALLVNGGVGGEISGSFDTVMMIRGSLSNICRQHSVKKGKDPQWSK